MKKYVEEIKRRVDPVLPALKALAYLTPTRVDDVAVAVIETLLDDDVLLLVEETLRGKLAEKGVTL